MAEENSNFAYHKAKENLLFWAAGLATVFIFFNFTLEVFGKGPVSFQMLMFYICILGTYSAQNVAIRMKDPNHNKRGEFFVFAIWLYCAVIYSISVYFKNPDMVPDQLGLAWQIVTALFFGTNVPKILKDLGFVG